MTSSRRWQRRLQKSKTRELTTTELNCELNSLQIHAIIDRKDRLPLSTLDLFDIFRNFDRKLRNFDEIEEQTSSPLRRPTD